ncbi:MAG: hypothetical protein R6U98_02050 [Pirellulaceae bacterium]
MESCPTQAVLPLVGLAAEKVVRDRYNSRLSNRGQIACGREEAAVAFQGRHEECRSGIEIAQRPFRPGLRCARPQLSSLSGRLKYGETRETSRDHANLGWPKQSLNVERAQQVAAYFVHEFWEEKQ